jgi:hypothetical protein
MYYFFIGSYEKGGFQNENLGDSKYLGRAKTKDKYLAFSNAFGVEIYNNDNLKEEVNKVFYKRNKDNINGDLYFIDNNDIILELDRLHSINEDNPKKMVQILNSENNIIDSIIYFAKLDDDNIKKVLKRSNKVVNEYNLDNKIKTAETVYMFDKIKGDLSNKDLITEIKDNKNM